MSEYDRLKAQWDEMKARKLAPLLDAAAHLELCAKMQKLSGRPEGPGNAKIHRKHAAAIRAYCDSDGSPKGEDALAASSKTTARAAESGIAPKDTP